MTVNSQVETLTAGQHASKGAFEELGVITVEPDTTKLCGLAIVATRETTTTAEAEVGKVRITGSSFPAQTYPALASGVQGVTNVGYRESPIIFIPLDIDVRGGEKIKIEYAILLAATDGDSVSAALFYADSMPSNNWFDSFNYSGKIPINKGGDVQSVDDAKTTAETEVTALSIPSWASKIVGWQVRMVPDAVATNGEHLNAYVILRANFKEFGTQELLMNAFHASLGTPTVGGNAQNQMVTYPADIPLPQKEITVTPAIKCLAATTGANVGIVGVLVE